MNIYWASREGILPPEDARFSCIPFEKDAALPFDFTAPQARVKTLPPPAAATVVKRSYLPEKSEWVSSVKSALSLGMPKVVLARCQVLELANRPDPFALTAALQERSKASYVFCFSQGDAAFFGASPERLFYRQGERVYSEAMAGTRPRGKTLEEDDRLGEELLESGKDFRELLPVRQFLEEALSPFCEGPLDFSPVSLHKTQNVQHLYSCCKAVLKNFGSGIDREILSKIHPTPALCGFPSDAAFSLIRKLEPFQRGLYGGALGWSSEGVSEWIVGIRSCLLLGSRAYLYSGTGIVAGSDPEEEWEELNQKGRLYEGIFL